MAVKSHVAGLCREAACVCRPCGRTAGAETRGWGGGEQTRLKREAGEVLASRSGSRLLVFPIEGSCRGEEGHGEGAR